MSKGTPRKVLLLGSGGLRIAQGGEFDYSGSQALKALREAQIETVLVNPNIATVQTSWDLCDRVYFVAVHPDEVTQVIANERPDAILLGFGGQTALNCGLALAARGVLSQQGVRVLGSSIETIQCCENRQDFAAAMTRAGLPVARGEIARSEREAQAIAARLGLPLMVRAGFSLGGQGSAIVHTLPALTACVQAALSVAELYDPHVLLEECLHGWKEIEIEVLRDRAGTCLAVCGMENLDAMGVHTGDSIVVAPPQTLTDEEYQRLRSAALHAAAAVGILGECNVQFALSKDGDFRVIELNPRLSRSSALASKATGYPLAYLATRVALGETLSTLRNPVTQTTSACCEPALDYVVCKIPRWDFGKWGATDETLGTEMRSVGEAMGIGRSLGEALQKALRMTESGALGLDPRRGQIAAESPAAELHALLHAIATPTPQRLFQVARAIELGGDLHRLAAAASIDVFFLGELARVLACRRRMQAQEGAPLSAALLWEAKRAGFSDAAIGEISQRSEREVSAERRAAGIEPHLRTLDTSAGEYPAVTRYSYLTYEAGEESTETVRPADVLLLGGGVYRIGSSVEFDWSCVSAALGLRQLGRSVWVLNCNPETVSTDFDCSDRLIFEEVSLETVRELCAISQRAAQRPLPVLISMGGQTPNRLALPLQQAHIEVLGTQPTSIDCAEDRERFSSLCAELSLAQPAWMVAQGAPDPAQVYAALGPPPWMVRPSYVLSGTGMRVVWTPQDLGAAWHAAVTASPGASVVISAYLVGAAELDFDGVAQKGVLCPGAWALSEHIEPAGTHSGDATLVFPPVRASAGVQEQIIQIAARLAHALDISGAFNVQVLVRDEQVLVLECNLRASRSLPFVSKALGRDLGKEAAWACLGMWRPCQPTPSDAAGRWVAVKAPVFSWPKMSGIDPLCGVQMRATGEVASLAQRVPHALFWALASSGLRLATPQRVLILGADRPAARVLSQRLRDLAQEVLDEAALSDLAPRPLDVEHARRALGKLRATLVLDLSAEPGQPAHVQFFSTRRAAVDLGLPLVVGVELATAVVSALAAQREAPPPLLPWPMK